MTEQKTSPIEITNALLDFPALQQLASALWRKGTARGAAVLVGSGYSKFADRPAADTLDAPLWNDLAREMTARLYPDTPDDAPSNPLRLAEEYRTYFGQAALDEFIRTRIADSSWEPGRLHSALLKLPWSDVLTTNWDTLLERAAGDVSENTYDVVRAAADLPHVRSPRIVKLHGSIGASEHFIFAEEDYRTYPARFAPFVNLARQVFIENELCLLGFSGDDPNFLQWSGWVRDHLGDGSRRIYLVGVLGLSAAKRKFLEARNIAPIDLSPLVKDIDKADRHVVATDALLRFLARAEPTPLHEWTPAPHSAYNFLPNNIDDSQRRLKDDAYAAALLDKAAEIWRADRQSYPGWLVCPVHLRQRLRFGTNDWGLIRKSSLDCLDPARRLDVLYELTWRYAIAFQPIESDLAELLVSSVENELGSNTIQKSFLAVALLRTARRAGDSASFERWEKYVVAHSQPETDLAAEVAYQRCLFARNRLDLGMVASHLEKLEGQDPIWRLRKAALLAELGECSAASKLMLDLRTDLDRRQRRDRNSIWLRSRRAWIEWLVPAIRPDGVDIERKSMWEFRHIESDPMTEIDAIRDRAWDALRKRREENAPVVPLFEAGHYKDRSGKSASSLAPDTEQLEQLDQLMETVGLPMRFNSFSFAGEAARSAAELGYSPDPHWYVWFLRSIQSHLDGHFDRFFGRIAVARMSPEASLSLTQRLLAAINYWRGNLASLPPERKADRSQIADRLRLFIAALSRLVVSQSEVLAQNCFELAVELANDDAIRHPWLFEPIDDLLKFAVQAIPPKSRSEFVLAALEFPLSIEKGVGQQGPSMRWPRPITTLWTTRAVRPADSSRWNNRIVQLIDAARSGAGREEAVLRLGYLAEQGVLTGAEREAFGAVLWSVMGPDALPADTGLLPHMFADLPAPQGIDAKAKVCGNLFGANIEQILAPPANYDSRVDSNGQNHFRSIIAAHHKKIAPTQQQAVMLFDRIVMWRGVRAPENGDPMGASLRHYSDKSLRLLLSECLALTIVPAMQADDLTLDRGRALVNFITDASALRTLAALPYFSNLGGTFVDEITQRIRRGIIGQSFDEVVGSTTAVRTWLNLARMAKAPDLPQHLVNQVISAVETRREVGLSVLLDCARCLLEARKLGAEGIVQLSGALSDLAVETEYDRIEFDSYRAVSTSLVRAECVKLARAFRDSGLQDPAIDGWLALVPADPMPEVRFALVEDGS